MTETLNKLLLWTRQSLGTKAAMRVRFGWMLAHFLDNINFKVIKIAGTNGKGSVSSMLSACLHQEGLRVGLFTSPHLISATERFRINEQEVSTEELELIARDLEMKIKPLVEKKGAAYTPSFFEILILIGIQFFSKHNIEIAIFEAGVGGTNDAVSLLPDFLSLITSIGLDHQKQLGSELTEIAENKAGIAAAGTLLVQANIDSLPLAKIQQISKRKELNYLVSKDWIESLSTTKIKVHFGKESKVISPSLRGAFQLDNINMVVSAYEFLLNKGVLASWKGLQGLERVRWPGRFELLGQKPMWIIDAAHNEAAIKALINALNEMSGKAERVLVFGNSEEKDYTSWLDLIPQIAGEVYLIDAFYKAVAKEKLSKHLAKKLKVGLYSSLDETLASLKKTYPHKKIVITGSIFMIGKARKWIEANGLDE